MILKASQRGGGQNLAAHLMRMDENEHIEIHEIRGFVADDLHGAFKEAYAISKGTKCRQYLFSMSMNPPPSEDVGIDIFENSIERTECDLGLENQPRVVVFHEKEGRRHAHVVWSRIDAETMTAKQMSFYKTKLKDLTREIFLEQNWKMPCGLADPTQRDPRNFSLAEWQQAKRAGQDPRATKSAIQDAWAISDTKEALEHALKERGFWLAKGNRRGHVVVDYDGEVHSLPRALSKKTKEVRARLGDPTKLADVAQTKRAIGETMTPLMHKHIDHAKDMFERRKTAFDEKRLAMRDAHRDARKQLLAKQKVRTETEEKERTKTLPKGLRGLWSRITGKYKKLKEKNELHAQTCHKRDRQERDKLIASQLAKRRTLQTSIQVQRQQQAETLKSLRNDRVRFRRLEQTPAPEPERSRSRGPTRDR
ncbi:MAG: relaxase/mobilization nuclease domain-containing protein [Pseudomonadota bacterium]